MSSQSLKSEVNFPLLQSSGRFSTSSTEAAVWTVPEASCASFLDSIRILAHSGVSSLSQKGLRSVFAGYVRVPSFELYVLSSHGACRAPSLLIFCSFGIGIAKILFFLNPVGWNWGGKCHTRSMSYAPLQSKVGYLNIKYATRWVLSRIKRLSQSGFDSKSSRIFQLSWIHLSSSDNPVVFAFWRYLALSAL